MRLRSLVALAILATVAVPRTAWPHGVLLSSSPAANSNLVVAPREIRLVFSERPERAFTQIRLLSPDGLGVALDSITLGPGNVAAARITGRLVAGLYTVAWRTIGRDGHPVSGEFAFSIGPDAAGVAGTHTDGVESGVRQPPSPAMREADFAPFAALLRWLTLASAIAMIGSIAFRAVVIRRLGREMPPDAVEAYVQPLARGAALLGVLAVVAGILTGALRLIVQLAATGAAFAQGGQLWALISTTMWGRAWLIQVSGLVLAATGFSQAKRDGRRAWLLAAGGGLAFVFGLALSGHAVAVPRFAPLAVAAHAIHTIAAGGWVGMLLVVATVALPLSFRLRRDDRWEAVARVVSAFSPAALAFGAMLLGAGLLITVLQLPSVDTLWTSEYGRVLLLKLSLVALTGAVGAYNWRRVRPALGELPGARRLRRSAAAELTFAALVLAVTAVLVATPVPLAPR